MDKHQPGTRAPVAHCLDCGEWTVWAKDGTAILVHKCYCPQVPDATVEVTEPDLCACGVPWVDAPLGHVRSINMETGEWACGDVKPVGYGRWVRCDWAYPYRTEQP